jgi:hypothetical protein
MINKHNPRQVKAPISWPTMRKRFGSSSANQILVDTSSTTSRPHIDAKIVRQRARKKKRQTVPWAVILMAVFAIFCLAAPLARADEAQNEDEGGPIIGIDLGTTYCLLRWNLQGRKC